MSDYYQILGVSPTVPTAEIRQAYVRLARERHPDRFSDPEEKRRAGEFFSRLSEAFNTLGNESKRREYDAQLAQPQPTTPEELAQEAYGRARKLLAAGDHAQAAELARVAAAHVPRSARYQLLLGRTLAKSPQTSREAVEAFEQALALDSGRLEAHVELGKLFLDLGLKLRARRVLEQGLRLAPGDATLVELAMRAGVAGVRRGKT